MCKNCVRTCVASTIATWGFFAVLLSFLGISNYPIKAIWLTILIFLAMFSCPLMNPKIMQCCTAENKKK